MWPHIHKEKLQTMFMKKYFCMTFYKKVTISSESVKGHEAKCKPCKKYCLQQKSYLVKQRFEYFEFKNFIAVELH